MSGVCINGELHESGSMREVRLPWVVVAVFKGAAEAVGPGLEAVETVVGLEVRKDRGRVRAGAAGLIDADEVVVGIDNNTCRPCRLGNDTGEASSAAGSSPRSRAVPMAPMRRSVRRQTPSRHRQTI